MSDISKDISEALDGANKRVADLEANVKTQAAQIEALASDKRAVWSKDDSKRPFSFAGAIRGMALGGLDAANAWKGFEREREAGVAARERALSQGTDSAGGYIVPEEHMAELIPLLVAKTVVLRAGATQLTGLTGSPVTIAKQTGGATAQWQNGENTSITPSDQTFGEVSMTPKMATAMTKMSRRLVALANPSVEQIVRNDLVGQLARLIDLAALRGSGASGQPLGIANTPSINTITSVGAPLIDDIYDALLKLEEDNAPMNSVALICHPRTWNSMLKLRAGGSTTTDGPYLVQPDVTRGAAGTILGYPVYTTTQLPINLGGGTNESVAYFGDFSELLIGMWGTLNLEATNSGGDAFQYHQVWLKAVQEMDVKVRHPESFVELSGITA